MPPVQLPKPVGVTSEPGQGALVACFQVPFSLAFEVLAADLFRVSGWVSRVPHWPMGHAQVRTLRPHRYANTYLISLLFISQHSPNRLMAGCALRTAPPALNRALQRAGVRRTVRQTGKFVFFPPGSLLLPFFPRLGTWHQPPSCG